MKKMSVSSMKELNGGLTCYKCGKFFPFIFGWEKRYNKHVASCTYGSCKG